MATLTMQSSNPLNNGAEAQSYLQVEDHLRKKARLSLEGNSQIPIDDMLSTGGSVVSQSSDDMKTPQAKSGRWSLDEKLMFLYGLSLFGKGRWKKIHAYVPDRSLVQIKSHAQKVLKRVEAGENVFQRLEDNRERLKELVVEANRRIDEKEAKSGETPKKKRKRASTRKAPTPITIAPFITPWEILQRQNSLRSKPRKKAEDAPSTSSSSVSSVPSLSSEDPPGVHASQQYDEAVRVKETITTKPDAVPSASKEIMPSGGTGAVIAAVAALCQLSARSEDP